MYAHVHFWLSLWTMAWVCMGSMACSRCVGMHVHTCGTLCHSLSLSVSHTHTLSLCPYIYICLYAHIFLSVCTHMYIHALLHTYIQIEQHGVKASAHYCGPELSDPDIGKRHSLSHPQVHFVCIYVCIHVYKHIEKCVCIYTQTSAPFFAILCHIPRYISCVYMYVYRHASILRNVCVYIYIYTKSKNI